MGPDIGGSAPRVAQEVQVLSEVRRIVAHVVATVGALLPVVALIGDGAKRW